MLGHVSSLVVELTDHRWCKNGFETFLRSLNEFKLKVKTLMHQPTSFSLPSGKETCCRSFSTSWFTGWRWLRYIDRVVCFSCVRAVEKGLINEDVRIDSCFVEGGFTNRKIQGAPNWTSPGILLLLMELVTCRDGFQVSGTESSVSVHALCQLFTWPSSSRGRPRSESDLWSPQTFCSGHSYGNPWVIQTLRVDVWLWWSYHTGCKMVHTNKSYRACMQRYRQIIETLEQLKDDKGVRGETRAQIGGLYKKVLKAKTYFGTFWAECWWPGVYSTPKPAHRVALSANQQTSTERKKVCRVAAQARVVSFLCFTCEYHVTAALYFAPSSHLSAVTAVYGK